MNCKIVPSVWLQFQVPHAHNSGAPSDDMLHKPELPIDNLTSKLNNTILQTLVLILKRQANIIENKSAEEMTSKKTITTYDDL